MHGCKQFIRGKPIRFGYKVWSLASSSGYMYHMQPYSGWHTGLGQGPSVVLGLAEQAQVPQGCKFIHDNLFTTLSLLDEMTKRGYGSRTVCLTSHSHHRRTSRSCPGEPLKYSAKERSCWSVGRTTALSQWRATINRWNWERCAIVKVKQPTCISIYNQHMGGVDLHDQQIARYHISIRSKKWWWPIFAWSLNSALVNSHIFYQDVIGGTIDLLTFSRIVAQSLMQSFGMKPLSHGRRSLMAAAVEDQAKYDNVSHWPINTMQRFRRCRHCDKRTTYACDKCKAPLHIEH